MGNRDLELAWQYHNLTKHSPESVRTSAHFLDWPNQPSPFKIYSDLESIPLEQDIRGSTVSAFEAMSTTPAARERPLSKADVAAILFLSAGITRRRRYPGGEILFRAAACTGALYHIDCYLITGALVDLEAGVYHFGPHDFRLTQLRTGDFRSGLLAATGSDPAVEHAPVVVACTSTFWRNSWKYQSRTYRHCFWDTGTMLANLRAAATARGVPSKVLMGFVDSWLNRLLALDTRKEVTLSLVALGSGSTVMHGDPVDPKPLGVSTKPLSASEVDYPAIREMHEACVLESADDVKVWLASGGIPPRPRADHHDQGGRLFPLAWSATEELPGTAIDQVILRRGSTRQFARESIAFAELSNALYYATRGIPGDFLAPQTAPLNDLYLIVNAVDGIPPGSYWFDRERAAVCLLEAGEFRREAGFLGLGQEIPADASVDIYCLTDLETVFQYYGNRGYRVAQLEASIIGGNLYLAAYAQGLGASGLTFFDDDVTEFFSPHAAGKSVMFLLALGRSVKRKTV